METEQAHSLPRGRDTKGRDAALRRPRTAQRAVPTIWLNLLCLDAPIVAVAWLCLFARTFHVPVHPGNGVALFLTAWLIYLADRLADASSLRPGSPRSLRQEFCLEHREIWISALLLLGGFDLYVIWRNIAVGTFFAGSLVGILALIYLALNHPRGHIWHSLPAKEVVIGSLFTAGTLVALLPRLPAATLVFVACALAFATLCSLNCMSIACWERALDRAQQKLSIATRHPRLGQSIGKISMGFGLASLAALIAFRDAALIFGCIGVSALLLALLNDWGSALGEDRRTALADLVLLTPVAALVILAL